MTNISTALGAPPATRLTGKQRKAIVAGSIGNTVEWVDWAVYATLAPVFASQFFAKGDPAAALLSTLAVFAVGFVMRPIGGALLGAYADRRGRKKGLTLTIGLMAGAALLIAICPTYQAIGIAASLSDDVSTKPISDAMSTPAPTDTCCQEPAKARRRGAADSTRNEEEEPNSPPAEKPCTSRASNRTSGAATPIAS